MVQINSFGLAISLLESTLGVDGIPLELHGRIATALALLDQQDGEDIFAAVSDAQEYIADDTEKLQSVVDGMG
nr:MAG TPA: hypothetical protein [Caudoviricetes sp.]DAG39372.1 MAG TPA: hypothetical protein [Caudoviricetes sp.]